MLPESVADDRVSVVGLGYVGLPLALGLAETGYDVVGVDIDAERISQLRDGESYVNDVSDEAVQQLVPDAVTPTTEYEELAAVDAVIICVPTPLRKTGTPDMSIVIKAVEQLADVLPQYCTVILESTVYPGATEEVVAPILADNGYVVGEDVFVSFSPERIDPGNETYGLRDIPKVIGGVTAACGDRAEALYEPVFGDVVRVESATEAEVVKLLENTFRAVNIGLINELAMVAHELDVDIWDAIDAAATKPFGFMPFFPGPGLGGHCIPVDPFYLSWKANQHDLETRFIELANAVNRQMPEHVVHRVTELMNKRGVPMSEASILILGTAYKPDVSDTRESPAFDVIGMLQDRNATIRYHDSYVPVLEVNEETYESTDLFSETLESVDCVLILTDHSNIDISTVVEHAPLVFDTRNATESFDREHVHRL